MSQNVDVEVMPKINSEITLNDGEIKMGDNIINTKLLVNIAENMRNTLLELGYEIELK